MEKRKITQSKITGAPDQVNADTVLPVVVNVREADYIPQWLEPRQKITPYIFTSNVRQADLTRLEQDKSIVSVAITDQLNMID